MVVNIMRPLSIKGRSEGFVLSLMPAGHVNKRAPGILTRWQN